MVSVAVVAMAACGSNSKDREHVAAHDSTSEVRNVIPAIAAAILEQADQFELLSLNPDHQQKAAEGDFHGYRILGTAVIKDIETGKKLVSTSRRLLQRIRASWRRVSNLGMAYASLGMGSTQTL